MEGGLSGGVGGRVVGGPGSRMTATDEGLSVAAGGAAVTSVQAAFAVDPSGLADSPAAPTEAALMTSSPGVAIFLGAGSEEPRPCDAVLLRVDCRVGGTDS